MSNDNQLSDGRTAQQEVEREHRIFTFTAPKLIWLLFGVLETLIAIRIGLRFIGANPETPIVSLIYGFTFLFLFPITGSIVAPMTSSIEFEISSMFAMMIYALIAAVIEKVTWLLFYKPLEPVHEHQTTTGKRNIAYSPTSKNE